MEKRIIDYDEIAISQCVFSTDLVQIWKTESTQLRVIGDVQRLNRVQLWRKKGLERIVKQNDVTKADTPEKSLSASADIPVIDR